MMKVVVAHEAEEDLAGLLVVVFDLEASNSGRPISKDAWDEMDGSGMEQRKPEPPWIMV